MGRGCSAQAPRQETLRCARTRMPGRVLILLHMDRFRPDRVRVLVHIDMCCLQPFCSRLHLPVLPHRSRMGTGYSTARSTPKPPTIWGDGDACAVPTIEARTVTDITGTLAFRLFITVLINLCRSVQNWDDDFEFNAQSARSSPSDASTSHDHDIRSSPPRPEHVHKESQNSAENWDDFYQDETTHAATSLPVHAQAPHHASSGSSAHGDDEGINSRPHSAHLP
ncbi:unnamed protein product [Mycena citricolor]|uniref:Uncharacterized protein n=1 Tax=Mycena citricolor TaxID=2018698 RepID=A0AAD2HBF9_9AGAR|nr:unnamed protein product [Mycena citricolor]